MITDYFIQTSNKRPDDLNFQRSDQNIFFSLDQIQDWIGSDFERRSSNRKVPIFWIFFSCWSLKLDHDWWMMSHQSSSFTSSTPSLFVGVEGWSVVDTAALWFYFVFQIGQWTSTCETCLAIRLCSNTWEIEIRKRKNVISCCDFRIFLLWYEFSLLHSSFSHFESF